MKRKKVNVAVTGLNNVDSPGPGIPVVRGLLDSKEYDVRIIGLSYDANLSNLRPASNGRGGFELSIKYTGVSNFFGRTVQTR